MPFSELAANLWDLAIKRSDLPPAVEKTVAEQNAGGAIVEVEEEVALDSLPAEVKAGRLAKAGKVRIGKVESIRKHDSLVAYEAHVDMNGEKSEVQVGPDGKPLAHEE